MINCRLRLNHLNCLPLMLVQKRGLVTRRATVLMRTSLRYLLNSPTRLRHPLITASNRRLNARLRRLQLEKLRRTPPMGLHPLEGLGHNKSTRRYPVNFSMRLLSRLRVPLTFTRPLTSHIPRLNRLHVRRRIRHRILNGLLPRAFNHPIIRPHKPRLLR